MPESKKVVIETMLEENLGHYITARWFGVSRDTRIKSWEHVCLEIPESLVIEGK